MGDGNIRRFALIINGDPKEARHLQNVEAAIAGLKQEGEFIIGVASPHQPKGATDLYQAPSAEGIENIVKAFREKGMDDDDRLVVYVTGHGGSKTDGACAKLPGDCYSFQTLKNLLDQLPYGSRFVYADTCQSGSAISQFFNEKTQALSIGSAGEDVACQTISRHFWSPKVPDANADGIVSIEERFQYAIAQNDGEERTLNQFYNPGLPVSLSGASVKKGDFPEEVVTVHSGKELDAQLAKLKPGQLALVTFSADWCGPCKRYAKTFDELANTYQGRFLMIRAEGVDGSEKDWHNYLSIKELPAVAFVDFRKIASPVEDKKSPIDSLSLTAINSEEEKLNYYTKKLASPKPSVRKNAVRRLVQMGPAAEASVSKIESLLNDESPDVVYAAIDGLLELNHPQAIRFNHLYKLDASNDRLWFTLKEAYEILIANNPKAALQEFQAKLEDESEGGKYQSHSLYGLKVYARKHDLTDAIHQKLRDWAKDKFAKYSDLAWWVLVSQQQEEHFFKDLDVILDLSVELPGIGLDEPVPKNFLYRRLLGAQGLPPQALIAIAQLLEYEFNTDYQIFAIQVLSSMELNPTQVEILKPYLQKAATEPFPSVAMTATKMLFKYKVEPRPPISNIAQRITNDYFLKLGTDIQKEILQCLAYYGPEAKIVLPQLIDLLKHGRPSVVIETLHALAAIGPEAHEALPTIELLVKIYTPKMDKGKREPQYEDALFEAYFKIKGKEAKPIPNQPLWDMGAGAFVGLGFGSNNAPPSAGVEEYIRYNASPSLALTANFFYRYDSADPDKDVKEQNAVGFNIGWKLTKLLGDDSSLALHLPEIGFGISNNRGLIPVLRPGISITAPKLFDLIQPEVSLRIFVTNSNQAYYDFGLLTNLISF